MVKYIHISTYLLALVQMHVAFKISFSNKRETPMLDMLDSMQKLMTSQENFDRKFYNELRMCMQTFDPRLPKAQDAAWQGIIDYWNMGGRKDDVWGSVPSEFRECNITATSIDNMRIYEPCNYASNIAYYHFLMELCHRKSKGKPFTMSNDYINALGISIASLAMGSSFMHGSNTNLGYQQDDQSIAAIAFLIHQGSLSGLPRLSPILTDLSVTPRSLNSLDTANMLQEIKLSKPVEKWHELIAALKIPDYFLTLGAYLTTILHTTFNPKIVNFLLPQIMNSLAMNATDQQFLINHYLPELRIVTANFNIQQNTEKSKTIGTILKLFHSLLWQEKMLISSPIVFKSLVNKIGARLLPKFNSLINKFSDFQYFNEDFHLGKNVYPGEMNCNRKVPHAKWHVISAHAVLDLIYLADEIKELLTSQ